MTIFSFIKNKINNLLKFTNKQKSLKSYFFYLSNRFLFGKIGYPTHVLGRIWIRNKKNIFFGVNITIANNASISPTQLIVGDNTWIGFNCTLFGKIEIGSNVMLGPNVSIPGATHNHLRIDIPMSYQGLTVKGTRIGNDVWVGANTVILDGITIGEGAIVGAGAVVTKDVAPYSIVVGNPARTLRMRKDDKP